LLELADDQHPDVGVGQSLPGLLQPPGEIGSLVGGGGFECEVHQRDRIR